MGVKVLRSQFKKMFNRIKRDAKFPSILKPSNITSIWKKKGSKTSFDNQRGVFNVSKLRSVIDKMVMDEVYETVDKSMGPSNIGARKGRNVRDHLLVIKSIINEAVKDKVNKTDVNLYDIVKCFDKMNYKATGNDMFEAGVVSDNFVVLAIENEESNVAVKHLGELPKERL